MEFISWKILISWPGLTFEVTIFLAYIVLSRRYLSDLSDIPGPFWASITRLWHIWHILEGKQNLCLQALHETYGPFVRIAPNEVSVCHPDGSSILLRTHLHKGDWYRVTAVPDFRFQNPMSITDPKKKIALSKYFAPAYTLTQFLKCEPEINQNIDDLLYWMDRYANDRQPMELDRFITYTTFDNVGSAFFSEPFGFIKAGRDIGGTLKNNVALSKFAAIAGFFILPLRILINPLNSWIVLLPMGQLFKTTSVAIKRRMQNSNARYDVLSHWLSANENNPDKLSLQRIEAQANVNVGAGSEPVSSAIQSFLYHTIQHPEAWLRVRNEVDAARARGLFQDRIVSFHDADQLPYFKACVKESLRRFSPTTMGLPRISPKDGITIAGRQFREGTILSISSHVVHSSKEIWGADADQWNPERWMSEDVKELEKNWLVFSAGYMTCPGRHFAKMQIFKIATTIVRDYDICQVDPENTWKYQANFTALIHSWPVNVRKRTC